jgi:hypothetical protein
MNVGNLDRKKVQSIFGSCTREKFWFSVRRFSESQISRETVGTSARSGQSTVAIWASRKIGRIRVDKQGKIGKKRLDKHGRSRN